MKIYILILHHCHRDCRATSLRLWLTMTVFFGSAWRSIAILKLQTSVYGLPRRLLRALLAMMARITHHIFDSTSSTISGTSPLIKNILITVITGALIIIIGYTTKIIHLQRAIKNAQSNQQLLKEQIQFRKEALKKQPIIATPPKQTVPIPKFIDILASLDNLATQQQVTIVAIQPLEKIKNQAIAAQRFKLICYGWQANLLTLLNSILFELTSLRVDELILQPSSMEKQLAEGQLAIHLTITFYPSINPNINHTHQLVSLKKIDTTHRNIFDDIGQIADLTSWELHELKLLGIIRKNGRVHGIVADPSDNIYQVTTGEKIGNNQSTITAISNCDITTNAQEQLRRVECR